MEVGCGNTNESGTSGVTHLEPEPRESRCLSCSPVPLKKKDQENNPALLLPGRSNVFNLLYLTASLTMELLVVCSG